MALADRLDTLAAFFYAGIVPSGSEDPYSLRRSAFGVIRIVVEAGLNINLRDILQQAEQLLDKQGVKAAPPQSPEAEGVPLLQFLEGAASLLWPYRAGLS